MALIYAHRVSSPISEARTRPTPDAEDPSRPAIVVRGRETTLHSDRLTTIGRSVKADVTLRHGTDMSREHVGFGRDGRWVWVEQVGTETSSQWDRVAVPRGPRQLWLPDGAIIRFCDWTIEVRAQDGPPIDASQLRSLAFAIMTAGPGASRLEVLDLLRAEHPGFASKTLSNQLGKLADRLGIPGASRGTGKTREMIYEIRRCLALAGRPAD